MTEGAELILSKSSIDAWLSCHYKWFIGYVWRIGGAPSLDMAVGTAVHAGVEAYWNGNDHVEATRMALQREVALMDAVSADEVARAVVDAHAMTKTYVEKIAPTFRPTMVEQDFLIRVNGQLVSGRLDAASETEVHDTKTTSTPSKVTPDQHRLGMTLYSWGYRALTGHLPEKLQLDIVAKNGRWAVKEVEPDYAGTAEVVGLVADGIKSNDFRPTGAAVGECPRCPYRNICRFSNAVDAPAIMEVLESVPSGEGDNHVTA